MGGWSELSPEGKKGPVSAVTLLLFFSLHQHCNHPLSTRDGRARPTAWGGQEGLGWEALGKLGLETGPRSAHTGPSMALSPLCCCYPKGKRPAAPCPWTHRYEEWYCLVIGVEWGGPLLFQDPQIFLPCIIPLPLPFFCLLLSTSHFLPSSLHFNGWSRVI